MTEPLWTPCAKEAEQTWMAAFMRQAGFERFDDLYQWSINDANAFWRQVWSFCGVIGDGPGDRTTNGEIQFEKVRFFPEACLNYAENLLKDRKTEEALVFLNERGERRTLSYAALKEQVSAVAAFLRDQGVRAGDRVAALMPNLPETVVCMLAVTSLGAIWSSTSPDFGEQGIFDRFSQIVPKVLICTDGYFYGGKVFSTQEKLQNIVKALPSLEAVLLVPYVDKTPSHEFPVKTALYPEMMKQYTGNALTFERVPFNHPLFILFSSGTTGAPKCIVHGHGGTLLQHLKEHQLHSDIKPGDRVFYFTTCGWMMWNWLISGLASGATILLYDGSPFWPGPEILFQYAAQECMTHFGTSAKYIDALQKTDLMPQEQFNLTSLRMMMSTGSPLAPESFDYVYRAIAKDICLASISGGTDIISCFALGNPVAPVWRGQLQTPGLGMKVNVFNDEGKPVRGEKGELVCLEPFPSMPVCFWNDPRDEKYHNAYFSKYHNIWAHGDYVALTPQGGLIIYGRSDAVLNPGGVRIGTSEIYRQVEQVPEVLESLAVGQEWDGDTRVILFVKLKPHITLTEDLKDKIRLQIRTHTTPRHVPAKIIQIADIPKTLSGKITELAVTDVIHGREVKNKEALANPQALELYRDLEDLRAPSGTSVNPSIGRSEKAC